MTPIGQESVESELFKNYCFFFVKLSFLRWPEVVCLSKGGRCSPPREPFAPSWAQNLRRRVSEKKYQAAPEGPHGPLAKKMPSLGASFGGPKVALESLGAILAVSKNVEKQSSFMLF